MIRYKIGFPLVFLILLTFVLLIGGTMPYYLFYILILTFVLPLIHNLIVLKGLKGYVKIPEGSLFSGDNLDIEYRIVNNSPLPIIYLEIESDISRKLTGISSPKVRISLGRKDDYIHRENLLLNRRGFYEVGEINVTIHDLFGFYSFSKKITTPTSLLVYPEIIKLSTFNIGASHQLGGLHVHDLAYEDRSRISTIREYREGDSIKSIHWKLSAKRDVPIIKDYEKRGDASTIILLDNEVSHFENDIDRRLEDKAVEATLGIIDYCLNHDINILIQTQDEEDYIELQGEQPSDIRPFLETLAKFKGNGSSDFRNIIRTTVSDFNNTSTIIIISPKLNKDIGAEGINLKFKNLNPIFIAITDIENNINYIDEMVEERLRKEGIPLYILDYNTDTKEALEGYYGFGKK